MCEYRNQLRLDEDEFGEGVKMRHYCSGVYLEREPRMAAVVSWVSSMWTLTPSLTPKHGQ